MSQVRGYQLRFQKFNTSKTTCIQIFPFSNNKENEDDDDNSLLNDEKKLISINIKDPSFISQQDINYAFNFGSVSLEILCECQNRDDENRTKRNLMSYEKSELCILLKKPKIQVGIESQSKTVDTSHFQFPQNCMLFV